MRTAGDKGIIILTNISFEKQTLSSLTVNLSSGLVTETHCENIISLLMLKSLLNIFKTIYFVYETAIFQLVLFCLLITEKSH